jgi:hypothetical protein
MPLKTSSRVVKNRAAWDGLALGIADAFLKAGEDIRRDAYEHAPFDLDHEEHAIAHGRGAKDPHMRDTDHVGVWIDGRKIGGGANKPRNLRMPHGQIVMAVGFGDPLSHLHEQGTIKMPAQPFLLPAFNRKIEGASRYLAPAVKARVDRVP